MMTHLIATYPGHPVRASIRIIFIHLLPIFVGLIQYQGSHKPGNLENLELSGNFVNLEKSGKSQGICDMVREFFYEMSHFSRVAYLTCINYVTRLFLCNQHF